MKGYSFPANLPSEIGVAFGANAIPASSGERVRYTITLQQEGDSGGHVVVSIGEAKMLMPIVSPEFSSYYYDYSAAAFIIEGGDTPWLICNASGTGWTEPGELVTWTINGTNGLVVPDPWQGQPMTLYIEVNMYINGDVYIVPTGAQTRQITIDTASGARTVLQRIDIDRILLQKE